MAGFFIAYRKPKCISKSVTNTQSKAALTTSSCTKSIVKHGKTAGQETQQRLGYYSKLEHLIRALINHEIRTGEAKTLQEMQDQITYISIWCEKAFAEVAHV